MCTRKNALPHNFATFYFSLFFILSRSSYAAFLFLELICIKNEYISNVTMRWNKTIQKKKMQTLSSSQVNLVDAQRKLTG